MAGTDRPEFLHVNQFKFSIDGVMQDRIHKIDGLHQRVQVTEHRYGNHQGPHPRKQAGRLEGFDVTVTKDVSATDELHKWRDDVKNPKAGVDYRKTISIMMLDWSGAPKGEFQLFFCLPKAWGMGTFSATSSGNLTETITFHVEKLVYQPA